MALRRGRLSGAARQDTWLRTSLGAGVDTGKAAGWTGPRGPPAGNVQKRDGHGIAAPRSCTPRASTSAFPFR